MPNPFADYYATLDNAALLVVVRNPDDHQPLAVEAARLELERRNFTEEQLAEAEPAPEQQKQSALKQWHGLSQAVDRIKEELPASDRSFWQQVADYSSGRRGALILAVIFTLAAIDGIYDAILYLQEMIRYDLYDFTIVLYLAGLLLTIVTPVLLWMQKKVGWVLCAGTIAYSLASHQTQLISEMFALLYFPQPEDAMEFNMPSYTPDPLPFIFPLILRVLLLAFACRTSITEYFGVSTQLLARTILIPFIAGTLITGSLLLWKYSIFLEPPNSDPPVPSIPS